MLTENVLTEKTDILYAHFLLPYLFFVHKFKIKYSRLIQVASVGEIPLDHVKEDN